MNWISICSLLAGLAAIAPLPLMAELDRLSDEDLADVSGQGGIYLSGDISINEDGGPIDNSYFGNCSESDKKCGARFAYRLKENGGWMVLDDIRGNFAFEGLTLRVRSIDSGFAGDGQQFDGDVVEIGLPDIVRFNDVRFKISASNEARPTAPNFRQTDIFAVEMQGDVVMEGNMLVFPKGNP